MSCLLQQRVRCLRDIATIQPALAFYLTAAVQQVYAYQHRRAAAQCTGDIPSTIQRGASDTVSPYVLSMFIRALSAVVARAHLPFTNACGGRRAVRVPRRSAQIPPLDYTIGYCDSNVVRVSCSQRMYRVRALRAHNNFRLFNNFAIHEKFGMPSSCFTNCAIFYKLIYDNCPIMLYTVKRKDKWQYKNTKHAESKYTFSLQNLNPDERIYFALRYARYSFLFNTGRTVRVRMLSYIFSLLHWPSRMLIQHMGLRATAQASISAGSRLL